jgi:hypothetical protein
VCSQRVSNAWRRSLRGALTELSLAIGRKSWTRRIAFTTSSVLMMLYRSKTSRVLCPEIAIAVLSPLPDRIKFRMALRRRSWMISPV